MEEWLARKESQSLGEWFFTECIAGLFQLIYRGRRDYTAFLTHFLKEGIPYLFLAAERALQRREPP